MITNTLSKVLRVELPRRASERYAEVSKREPLNQPPSTYTSPPIQGGRRPPLIKYNSRCLTSHSPLSPLINLPNPFSKFPFIFLHPNFTPTAKMSPRPTPPHTRPLHCARRSRPSTKQYPRLLHHPKLAADLDTPQ
jgi:hypothetical protein